MKMVYEKRLDLCLDTDHWQPQFFKKWSVFFLDCKWTKGDSNVMELFERADLSVNMVASFWRAHQIRIQPHPHPTPTPTITPYHFYLTTKANPFFGALRAISRKRLTVQNLTSKAVAFVNTFVKKVSINERDVLCFVICMCSKLSVCEPAG
jgi:hypothetical protein